MLSKFMSHKVDPKIIFPGIFSTNFDLGLVGQAYYIP